jgi:hypothetical protein
MSMILLVPANKITQLNVEIKRRTISLTGLSGRCIPIATPGPAVRAGSLECVLRRYQFIWRMRSWMRVL